MLNKDIILLGIFFFISARVFSLDITSTLEAFYSNGLNRRERFETVPYYEYSELKSYIKYSYKDLFVLTEPRIRFNNFVKSSDFYTDQFYIKFSHAPLEIKLGKQRLGWGKGYLWNVVNNIDKQKDALVPTKYIIGQEGVNLSYTSSKFFEKSTTSFDLAYSSKNEIYGINAYNITEKNLETGLVLNYKKDDFSSLGVYSSYDLSGLVFGIEAVNFYEKRIKRDYQQCVFNLNKNFNDDLFVLTEYLYNQKGLSEDEFKKSLFFGSFSNLVPGYIFKKYIYLLLDYKINDDLNISTSSIYSLETKGGFFYPNLKYSKIKDINLSLEYVNNYKGNKIDEFYLSPYKDYINLRAEYFF